MKNDLIDIFTEEVRDDDSKLLGSKVYTHFLDVLIVQEGLLAPLLVCFQMWKVTMMKQAMFILLGKVFVFSHPLSNSKTHVGAWLGGAVCCQIHNVHAV